MDKTLTLAALISTACVALRGCESSWDRDAETVPEADHKREWLDKWGDLLNEIDREFLPAGAGFDCGTTVDRERTDSRRIVLDTSFHHMNEGGGYDGWTEHTVYVHSEFSGASIGTITGRNRNEIKDYIGDVLSAELSADVLWTAEGIERIV